jgi:hypothetical protein
VGQSTAMTARGQATASADALLATATGYAARSLQTLEKPGDGHLVEKDLKLAMSEALEAQGANVRSEVRYTLPHWEPQPGAVDLTVPDSAGRYLLAELKWANDNKIYEALWDAVKLADATQLDEVGGVYLVSGASDAHWTKPVECAEMFDSGACHLVDLIKQHQEWWDRYILGDSTGRPISSPATLNITSVSDVRFCVHETVWRLRTVRLDPTGEPVEFREGRPA